MSRDQEEPFDLETATLEPPGFGENDWGGDGTDLHRPVRAHVLAALVPISEPYAAPVDRLLRLGDARDAKLAGRRTQLGIGQQHVPELVRMARDRALNTADGDDPAVWAPVHAIELLTELDTAAVLDDLLALLDVGADWFDHALPEILASGGQTAIEPLRRYLFDTGRWTYGRAHTADALTLIAQQHPELRDTVVDVLRRALAGAEHNTEAGNGLLLGRLLDLNATEALPEIRAAFAAGLIDETVAGDWATVLGDLGFDPEPGDPLVAASARRFEQQREAMFPAELRESLFKLFGEPPAGNEPFETSTPALEIQPWSTPRAANKAAQQAKSAKHKRKTAAASRKANKRKHK